jgi:glycosyltransferase involved in cell wall biosynthesis
MKILHFIPALAKGGAERVVTDLANHAAEAGHEVTIVAAFPTDSSQWPAPLNESVQLRYIVPHRRPTSRIYPRLPLWMLRNRKWLLDQDVAHCHLTFGSIFGSSLQVLRSFTRASGPVVVETNHSVGMAILRRRRAFHARLLSGRDAVALMAEDPYWRGVMASRRQGLWRVIPNGVAPPPPADPAAVAGYRRDAGIPDGALVVGSVGRLLQERRPDLLLDAFLRLTRLSRRNVHLLLAGEGPVRAELAAAARRMGVEGRVHLPGLITNPVEAFSTIDLYLTVNVGEITGIAALEAAFTGVPIAAIQLDRSHVRDSTEWIWSSPDPQELAAYVSDLLEAPATMKRLAAKQQAYARANHSVAAMADAYQRLYGDAIERRRAAAVTSN